MAFRLDLAALSYSLSIPTNLSKKDFSPRDEEIFLQQVRSRTIAKSIRLYLTRPSVTRDNDNDKELTWKAD